MLIDLPLGNSAVIVSKDRPNELVVVHRKEDNTKVCFPGGKLDPGESSIEAIVREVFEETGIVVNQNIPIPIYAGVCEGNKEYWVTAYLIEVSGDIILLSSEPEMQPKWMNKNEFLEKNSFPIYNNKVFDSIKRFWL